MGESSQFNDHDCTRCGESIDLGSDTWYNHSWNEEPPPDPEEMAKKDWFSESAMLCEGCQEGFESFLFDDTGEP